MPPIAMRCKTNPCKTIDLVAFYPSSEVASLGVSSGVCVYQPPAPVSAAHPHCGDQLYHDLQDIVVMNYLYYRVFHRKGQQI